MVVRKILLHCVICQMNLGLEWMNVKFIWWCSNVTLLIPVCSSNTINTCDQHVVTNVELTIVVQERTVKIHLNNKCALLFCRSGNLLLTVLKLVWWELLWFAFMIVFSTCLFDDRIKLINFINHSDSSTLIGVLSGLDNPNISHFFLRPVFSLLLFLFLLLLNHFTPFLVILAKPYIFWILYSVFYMKCQRDVIKRILFDQ